MTSSALIMMIVAIVVIFGGLIVSAVTLMTHPEQPDADE
ncbi:methionine/alanine import family NSS transporter small subunit [Glycomyces buryatensis]|uniref:Methionine/alanine import family NSS transporter small subunit n=1 Tax=Glycomyces buryatensis TaxID=2570927 RepID=A0A4V4HRV8_9ACTN|nr:methionine/alanine import family NSS transporter small subunit [Glycomyces buryatensis]THV39456.1 methionine/alanine import family NSS transporter small subunit [Glycomyces buryatensis]